MRQRWSVAVRRRSTYQPAQPRSRAADDDAPKRAKRTKSRHAKFCDAFRGFARVSPLVISIAPDLNGQSWPQM